VSDESTTGSSARPRRTIAALASTSLLASFLQTIMTPLVPELPGRLGETPAAVSWVLTAALLAACATAPVSGRLGDIVGKKPVILALLGVIVLGSVVGALSTDLPGIIVARALQGVGLGVMALNVSVLRDVVPADDVPRGIAVVTAGNGIGGGVGLPVAATVSQLLDYHWLFVLAGLCALASAIAVALAVPRSPVSARTRVDVPGALGVAIGLTGVMLAVSQGADWGWMSPATLACGLGGLAVLVLWALHELRTSAPLIDLRLVGRGPVLLVNLVSALAGFCWFAVPGGLARLAQAADGGGAGGLGLDMITTSLLLLPTGLVLLVCARPVARVVTRHGPRAAAMLGSAVLTVTFAAATVAGGAAWQLPLIAAAAGLGCALVYTAAPTLMMRSVPASVTASANAINAVMRWLGSTVSSSIIGAAVGASFVLVAGAPEPTSAAFDLSFAITAGCAATGLVLAWFLPRAPRPPRP
jgi:MFS family permease